MFWLKKDDVETTVKRVEVSDKDNMIVCERVCSLLHMLIAQRVRFNVHRLWDGQ